VSLYGFHGSLYLVESHYCTNGSASFFQMHDQVLANMVLISIEVPMNLKRSKEKVQLLAIR